jgi:hypothetical protein
VLAQRRIQYDNLLWQSPALALVAQAFLLSIALSPTTSTFARAVASLLGIAVSAMTIQVMIKNRYEEMLDAKLLEGFERAHNLPPIHSAPYRSSLAPDETDRAHLLAALTHGPIATPGRWEKVSSFEVWKAGLTLFALIDAGILVVAVFFPKLL